MRFTKMHGLGNSYIYLDLVSETSPYLGSNWSRLARRLSDVNTGIGSDGLILVLPPGADSGGADFRMRVFDKNGSEVKTCGNGLRCVAKYVYERGLTRSTKLAVQTEGGLRHLDLFPRKGKVETVRAEMGRPGLTRGDVGMASAVDRRLVNEPLEAGGKEWRVTGVAVGNPHCVIFVDDVRRAPVGEAGPRIERHPAFWERVNVEFVEVKDDRHIRMRVWERGSGETQACGTGACAAAVAAALNGYTGREVGVELPGGALHIEWADDDRVYMTGPATTVCTGELEEEWFGQAAHGAPE